MRDVTFDEGRARARAGTIPECMAGFRDGAIGPLRLGGEPNIAARPALALAAVGLMHDLAWTLVALERLPRPGPGGRTGAGA